MATGSGTLTAARTAGLARGAGRRSLLAALGFGVSVLVWEAVTRAGVADPLLISRPGEVAGTLWTEWTHGQLAAHTGVTLRELAWAYGLALPVGAGLGMVMGLFRPVEWGLEIPLWFLYNAPLLAFYPLLIVWFGLGTPSVVAIGFLLSVFPVLINTMAGMRLANPLLVRCARSFCAPRSRVVLSVFLPSAVPMIVAGMRIAVGRGLTGVVVGELFGGNKGLGFVIAYASAQLQAGRAMAALAVVVTLGVVLTSVVGALEAWLTRRSFFFTPERS